MSQSIFAYIVGAIILLAATAFLSKPLKRLLKIVFDSAIGFMLIVIFNFFSGLLGLYIGVNAATAVTVGVLGLPGFVMILILQGILGNI